MNVNCNHCRQNFEITDADLKFYDDVSPIIGGEKMSIPPPLMCPQCRFQRRLAFRNERHLYHRKCDLTGKQIVSLHAPDKLYKAYHQDEWWSDQWDALDYGRDFDFSRSFTEQLKELSLAVPHVALNSTNAINSYYTNHAVNTKNCYLVFGVTDAEDCLYGRFIISSKDVVDSLSLYSCERCYEGIASQQCYGCMYFMNCRNCSDCLMVEDCTGCKNCICCFGLKNKEYYVLNKEVGKEAYEKYWKDVQPLTVATLSALRTNMLAMKAALPHRHAHIFGSEDCTGDMIFNSKNCQWCFDVTDCEDSKHLCYTPKGIMSQDCTYNAPQGVRHCYNTCSVVGSSSIGTFLSWYGDSVFYSMECHYCRNLLGCIGLRRKEYCIFNKQFTKEQYEELAPKIIEYMQRSGEWGEYLDPSLSFYGYNQTVAQEIFPLERDKASASGWQWYDEKETHDDAYMGPKAEPLADIRAVKDDICSDIFACEATGKLFKIVPQELKFYRSMGLPIPRRSPDQRHKDRMNQRNPRYLWSRKCDKCGKDIQTTYSPQRPETVYCEDCYLSAIY